MDMPEFNGPLTPKIVVERNIRLNVPVYQRLFVWKEGQIHKLLSDLYLASEKNPPQAYYVGVVSVWEKESGTQWDLVDGQQRLTFISLLAAWIVSELGDKPEASNWRNFLFVDGSNLRLAFTGRDEDKDAIIRYSKGEKPKQGSFRIFSETVATFFSGKDLSNKVTFAKYVFSNFSFLADVLPAGYGAHELNLHFEKMNSTGRQLEPIDMVKGLYFGTNELAERWNKVFRTSDLHGMEISIEEMINTGFGTQNDATKNGSMVDDDTRRESQRLVSDEVMLLHALCIAKGDDSLSLDKSRLLESFAKHICREGGEGMIPAGDVMKALEDYSRWMDKYIVRIEKDERRGENKYVFVSAKDAETDEDENPYDDQANASGEVHRSRKLKQFEAFLYVASDDSQRWILNAYLRSRRESETDDEFLQMLKTIDCERHRLPEDRTPEAPCWSYGTIDRYWFWKLDYLLWERHEDNKDDPLFAELRYEGDHDAISFYVFRRDRSIEHLHPQNPPPESESDEWKADRDNSKDAVRNGFGNLAMIASWFNSSQGHDSISTKTGRINDQVREKRLQSIKLLLMVRSVELNPVGWSKEAAHAHGKQMLDFFQKELGG